MDLISSFMQNINVHLELKLFDNIRLACLTEVNNNHTEI